MAVSKAAMSDDNLARRVLPLAMLVLRKSRFVRVSFNWNIHAR